MQLLNYFLISWKDSSTHKKVWVLTLPMILSNLSIPLVSLVDTMVMGRLPEAHNLAAVTVGSTTYLFIVGCLSFFRMGTIGFTAQAVGRQQGSTLRQILIQSLLLALGLSILLIFLAIPFYQLTLYWIQPNQQFHQAAQQFFNWRILGLPAALLNYTLVGWFLGSQNARIPLLILITTNIINMVLSVWFVLYLDKGVVGAGQAAVIAEWSGCLIGFCFIYVPLKQYAGRWLLSTLKHWHSWQALLTVNRDIFIRSLTLQGVFFLLMLQGARLGEETVSANIIIINGLTITAYILDGFAHAIEALCGKAIGEKNKLALGSTLIVACGWALLASVLFAISFLQFGDYFVNLQTTISTVREQAYPLIPYLAVLPLIAVWSYLLDGLFISATRAKEMRNSMLLAFIISLPLGLLLQPLANNGLWITFLTFMVLRSIILGYISYNITKRNQWIQQAT
ncbi:MATE family efflux transporter [Entomomonas asaccharolytica]|nr:MATE family efflux transporter [Entomomonas asaccharolytica]